MPGNPVIVEAGCADGRDTVVFARKFTAGKIYGVEPHPDLFNTALINTKELKNVKLLNYALADENNEHAILYTGNSQSLHQSSSLLRPTSHLEIFPDIEFSEKIEVKTVTLSSLMKDLDLDAIDLLWLDLQGFEIKVLGEDLSIMAKIKLIHLEVHRIQLYENSPTIDEIEVFMNRNNFECIKRIVPFVSGNAIYKNSKL